MSALLMKGPDAQGWTKREAKQYGYAPSYVEAR
jgi:hypothetical protein